MESNLAKYNANVETINIREGKGYLFVKRLIDILGSIVGLIVLSPVFLLVGIAIKIEDPKGNILFGHKRVGKDGKLFSCWKFRSMFANAEQMLETLSPEQKKEYAETFKLQNDPRVTKVGKFIRNTSLDELPQLFNILMGEMTIVGPRPIVTKELDFYGVHQDVYKAVQPGLTGLWQVSGRSDTSYDERVKFDLEYVATRNTFRDIYIMLMTVVKVIKREGAC